MNVIVLKCQYQLKKKFKKTLYVLNKHTTVKPQVSSHMSFMDPAIIDHILQFGIRQIIIYFLRSVRKDVSSMTFSAA